MTKAQKLVKFLNEELKLQPEKVNLILEILRERTPGYSWDKKE